MSLKCNFLIDGKRCGKNVYTGNFNKQTIINEAITKSDGKQNTPLVKAVRDILSPVTLTIGSLKTLDRCKTHCVYKPTVEMKGTDLYNNGQLISNYQMLPNCKLESINPNVCSNTFIRYPNKPDVQYDPDIIIELDLINKHYVDQDENHQKLISNISDCIIAREKYRELYIGPSSDNFFYLPPEDIVKYVSHGEKFIIGTLNRIRDNCKINLPIKRTSYDYIKYITDLRTQYLVDDNNDSKLNECINPLGILPLEMPLLDKCRIINELKKKGCDYDNYFKNKPFTNSEWNDVKKLYLNTDCSKKSIKRQQSRLAAQIQADRLKAQKEREQADRLKARKEREQADRLKAQKVREQSKKLKSQKTPTKLTSQQRRLLDEMIIQNKKAQVQLAKLSAKAQSARLETLAKAQSTRLATKAQSQSKIQIQSRKTRQTIEEKKLKEKKLKAADMITLLNKITSIYSPLDVPPENLQVLCKKELASVNKYYPDIVDLMGGENYCFVVNYCNSNNDKKFSKILYPVFALYIWIYSRDTQKLSKLIKMLENSSIYTNLIQTISSKLTMLDKQQVFNNYMIIMLYVYGILLMLGQPSKIDIFLSDEWVKYIAYYIEIGDIKVMEEITETLFTEVSDIFITPDKFVKNYIQKQ
jgi:hypothetical protein